MLSSNLSPNVWKLKPQEIEDRSFAIIDQETPGHNWDDAHWVVIRRMIHTSADFDYAKDTLISAGAVESGMAALKSGRPIVTDTRMALSGISAARLSGSGNQLNCLINDPRTMSLTKQKGHTRAMAAVDLAFDIFYRNQEDSGIWVIGNAPTALFRLLERLEKEPDLPRPKLIVGLPVGFVNAAESKAALARSSFPYITNRGRKGGSNVAAAVINALTVLANA